jgi:hypothetical protein
MDPTLRTLATHCRQGRDVYTLPGLSLTSGHLPVLSWDLTMGYLPN